MVREFLLLEMSLEKRESLLVSVIPLSIRKRTSLASVRLIPLSKSPRVAVALSPLKKVCRSLAESGGTEAASRAILSASLDHNSACR